MDAARVKTRLQFSRWLWSLGATPRDSLALIASYNSRVARKRLRLPGVLPVTAQLRLRDGTLPFEFQDTSDFIVLNEVFREKQYELPSDLDPEVVLDLGANTGLSPLFFRGVFPRARIVAVEAHPETYARLQSNASRWENIELIRAAASNTFGTVELFGTAGRSISSSIFKRPGSNDPDSGVAEQAGPVGLAAVPQSVPSEPLSALLDRCGPHVGVLKFDIEGAEKSVFEGFEDWQRIGILIGEVHPDLYGGSLEDFFDLFPRHRATVLQTVGVRAVVRLDPI